ncbi:hypothetical protein R1sor_003557 [Riccia sorocarpa]|uniref:F-box domain-containing protein n=1 Tax=Riccia sorocarpa TaxID=122646 RepID=A0ABD3H5D5_9MARC
MAQLDRAREATLPRFIFKKYEIYSSSTCSQSTADLPLLYRSTSAVSRFSSTLKHFLERIFQLRSVIQFESVKTSLRGSFGDEQKLFAGNMDLTYPTKRQSRTVSFTAATQEDELLPSVWQHLPTELLEQVLNKLPLSALRKFSRVSKRWKAWFRSVEFARECESVEWTFFYLDVRGEISYMLLPNLKTNSWDKHSLDFLQADEGIAEYHVAIDKGLLCYSIRKKRGFDPSITLVVQNPLTRKWRRLIAPYQLQRDLPTHKRVWGLMVDTESGSYKVVVAFYDHSLPRKSFIYDSVSDSWSTSAALTPALVPHFDEDGWRDRSIACSGGELLWVIEEYDGDTSTDGLFYKSCIKYNFELDAWSMATQQSPVLGEGEVYMVHHDVENRLMMVNLQETRPEMEHYAYIPSDVRFPVEFLELVPNSRKVGIEDIEHLVDEAGTIKWPTYFEPKQVAFGGGTWYIVSDFAGYSRGFDIFAVTEKPLAVTRLPKIYDQVILRLGTFAATLKAFV